MFSISNIKVTGSVLMRSGSTTPPPSGVGGSLLFNGTSDAFYSASSGDFNIGTGNFTIEWFQKQLMSDSHPRVFSVGQYPSASAAVSIEGNIFYFWANGSYRLNYSPKDSFVNRWVHIAIVRNGSALTVYEDGSLAATTTYTGSVGDSSETLFMGNEGLVTTPNDSFFNGNITNFRWSKGVARYTTTFSKPTAPLTTIDSNTKALYLASTAPTYIDDASDNHTLVDVSGSSVTWSSDNPF